LHFALVISFMYAGNRKKEFFFMEMSNIFLSFNK
jgi:hypothetical protein